MRVDLGSNRGARDCVLSLPVALHLGVASKAG